MDELKLKKVQLLADKGFDLLREGEYEEAIAVSNKLKEARFSAAFDIGAQAHAGLGNIENAVLLLEEGLKHAPHAWPNWQLLGNYLSDLNKYSQAKKSFERALQCEDVWEESIYLNQAILSNRMNEYSEAINISTNIKDGSLYLHKIEVNITALIGLNRFEEAMNLANQVLSKEEYPEDQEEIVGRIAANLAEIYLKQGRPKHEVRAFLFHSLSYDQNNANLLSSIRDIDNKYSDKAKYYRSLIHCTIPVTSPDYENIKGYYCNYDVIAETTEEVIQFVKQFEEAVVRDGQYNIDEYEILDDTSTDPCGVYSISGRTMYENEE